MAEHLYTQVNVLNCVKDQTFESIREIADLFEKIFGSAKTYHELTGELSKVKQKNNEPVVKFMNRVKELQKEIYKTAVREERVTDDQDSKNNSEKDCIKFFLRGLQSEIKCRIHNQAVFFLSVGAWWLRY